MQENKPVWEDITREAKRASKQLNTDLDFMSYFWVEIKRPNPAQPGDRLYYHRRPLAGASPRDFWGFISTSPDPSAPSTGLEHPGWSVGYNMYADPNS